MTLATQTPEVIGIRRKDADSVTVELGQVQADPAAMPMPFGSHTIEVAVADMPQLGALVTLTFALQP
jgi:hypothetical protein